jgi:hypothetical protein
LPSPATPLRGFGRCRLDIPSIAVSERSPEARSGRNNRRIKGLIQTAPAPPAVGCHPPEKLLAIFRFFVKNALKTPGDKAK